VFKKIIILVDDKSNFWWSINSEKKLTSLDTKKVMKIFNTYGFQCETISFSKMNFDRDYSGNIILYQSSEDTGLFYKSFIEDILLWLEDQGAILLPAFKYFRMHHNKAYMELNRYKFVNPILKTIRSRVYGKLTELDQENINYPVVFKLSEGAGSRNVALARNVQDLVSMIKKLTGVFLVPTPFSFKSFFKLFIKQKVLLSKAGKDYPYRSKFVIQNFIPNMNGDFKVLRFGDKYYVLCRLNREGDFRASGSGKLSNPDNIDVSPILDFAQIAANEIGFPLCSMDIGFDGTNYHLLEYQCVHFGPYTLQFSNYWFEHNDNKWEKILGKSILEEEFCNVFIQCIKEY